MYSVLFTTLLQLREMFGAGTACVVCPVKSIDFLDEVSDDLYQGTVYCAVIINDYNTTIVV